METGNVLVEQSLHLRIDLIVAKSFEAHRFADNLTIGLSVIPVFLIPRRTENRGERALHRYATHSAAAKDRSVYVEEYESHVRVRKSPEIIVPVPIPCHTVGVSLRKIHATRIAITG